MNARLQLIIACLPYAMKEHGACPEHAVYMANKILNTMADTEPKPAPQASQAADDEAWFARQSFPMLAHRLGKWGAVKNIHLGEPEGEGPTIAAAIRALREKVEGGAQ